VSRDTEQVRRAAATAYPRTHQAPRGWTDTIRQLVIDVVPDSDGELYVVDHDWLLRQDDQLRGLSLFDGLAGSLAFLVQGPLQAAGLWRGPGRIITVRWLGCWASTVGIALHEAGHLLSDGQRAVGHQPLEADELPAVRSLAASFAAEWPQAYTQHPVPWFGHHARFVRACCQLWHRAEPLLASLRPHHLRFGDRYYGWPFTELAWLESLHDELQQAAGPIRDILDSPPPQAFVDLYHRATGERP
jgi:hypothetical protein